MMKVNESQYVNQYVMRVSEYDDKEPKPNVTIPLCLAPMR